MANHDRRIASEATTPQECYLAGKSQFEDAAIYQSEAKYQAAAGAFTASHAHYERGVENASPNNPILVKLHTGAGLAMLRSISLHASLFGGLDKNALPHIDNAQSHFEDALALHPKDPAPLRARLGHIICLRAKATRSRKQYEKSLKSYEQAIHAARGSVIIDPVKNHENYVALAEYIMDKASVHCSLSELLRRAGKLEKALTHNERAADLSEDACGMQPKNEPMLKRRADMLAQYAITALEADRLPIAADLIRDSYDIDSDSTSILYVYGKVAMRANDFYIAITMLGKAIDRERDHKPALVELGNCFYKLRRYEQARDFFSHAAELDDPEPSLINYLAICLFNLGQVDEAIDHLQFALELDPDNFDAHHNLGYYFCSLERWDEADAHIRKALVRRPNSALSHMVLGMVLTQKGAINVEDPDSSPALAAFRKARSLDPNSDSVAEELAKSLIAHGLYRESADLLNKALTRRTLQSLHLEAILQSKEQPVAQ